MRIFFRTDSSNIIGSGHLMRCISLAIELSSRSSQVAFVMRSCSKFHQSILRKNNFKLIKMEPFASNIQNSITLNHKTWLGVSEDEDFQEFLSLSDNPDLIVIDHYGIGSKWEKKIKDSLPNTKTIVLDDLKREHCADIIIDQTLGRSKSEYIGSKGKILTGANYAILRKGFSKFHTIQKSNANYNPANHQILINFGGYDEMNLTIQSLKELSKRSTPIKTSVIINDDSNSYNEVINFINSNNDWISQYDFVENMDELLSQHTICVGAPGSSSWERACLGLPSVLIKVAENQSEILSALLSHQAVFEVLQNEIEVKLNKYIDKIINNFSKMRKANLSICDGNGAQRIAKEISNLK